MQGSVAFLLLAVACLGFSSANSASKVAPRFAINLDLAPKQRWTEVILKYEEDIERLLAVVRKLVTREVLDLLGVVGKRVETVFPYPYNEELMGVAETLKGVNIGDVMLVNALYEITAFNHGKKGGFKACTSIVAEDLNGTIIHGRNLDYSIHSLLCNLTITVDFQKGGKTMYTGSTYAGFVGLLTGQKPYAYTISINERDKGGLWMNALEALANGMNAGIAIHIRDTLANEEFDYEEAVVFLSSKALIAPCYLIIGGIESSQGAVITRDRTSTLDFVKIHAEKGQWYVLETNYDLWVTPPASDDRRDPAIKYMNEMGRGKLTEVGLFNVLSTAPVLNDRTSYTVVMSAAHPERYNTWIRNVPSESTNELE